MARPLLPPKFVAVPADIVYDTSVPAGVFRTYVQLRGLLWGMEEESQDFTIKQLMEVTGLSRSALYGHLGILRDCGWLLSSSTHYSRITIYLHGGAQDAEETNNETVDKAVDKPVDNLSRNLDSSIKEDVKDFKSLPPEFNLPPDYLDNPREEAVQKSGQPVQKSGRVSKNLDKNNGWHDVIDRPLEGKLERLGVFPQVYGQVAEAVRSGEWTLEKVKELADDILDLGDSAGPGVFVFRLKNKIRQESAAEKQEKARDRFRQLYRNHSEVISGA
mgnify:CR=1 FL=1